MCSDRTVFAVVVRLDERSRLSRRFDVFEDNHLQSRAAHRAPAFKSVSVSFLLLVLPRPLDVLVRLL
uniref:Uncharacterized protein n=1 Tax=Rhizobium leguminosarum TaxID=384 RepID=A0A179BEE2_RHILE|nr:hypothetical protein A4U53_31520 [Rhizobium leguminosarum]